MKNFPTIFTVLLGLFLIVGCTSNEKKTTSNGLDDIVESPPEKKVNKAPSSSKKQTTTGTFTEMETGDYYYIHMISDDKEKMSFMMLQAYLGADELNMDNWKSVKNKKIAVTWEETETDIPEAGGKMKVKKVLGVDVLE